MLWPMLLSLYDLLGSEGKKKQVRTFKYQYVQTPGFEPLYADLDEREP